MDQIFVINNGVKLEAEIFQSNSDDIDYCVLICHPHPQYGGNMFNNVVSGVFNKLVKNNVSCLRFNFRGVGRSTGSHSDGTGELSDVYACVDYLVNKKNYKKIMICGYSYGAAIGCSAVKYSEKIVGYISISFPFDFVDEKYKEMSQTTKPKLFIQGNRDDVALYEKFEENYNYYYNPKSNLIIEGADHFYRGFEDRIGDRVFDFLQNF
ncbi:MAG: alpha/beta hydrolase [Promethearchaeota archaeon]|jgi:alpha/beta superfamily hydrolase